MQFSIIYLAALCTLTQCMNLPAHARAATLQARSDAILTPSVTIPESELVKRKLKYSTVPAIASTCSASLRTKGAGNLVCGATGSLVSPGNAPTVYQSVTEQTCIDICLCADSQAQCSTISWEASSGTCTLYKKKIPGMGLSSSGSQVLYQRDCFTTTSPTQTAAANFAPQKMRRTHVDDEIIRALASY